METIDISHNKINGGLTILPNPKPMTPEDLAKMPVINGTFTIKK